jgi:hypothetical protein
MIFTFRSLYLYISIIRATFPTPFLHPKSWVLPIGPLPIAHAAGKNGEQAGKADVPMNGLHWLAQIFLTGVFLFDGWTRIVSYRREEESQPARKGFGSIRLPYELTVAVAVAEIAGALALWVPANLWPPDILPRLAASALALLAVAGSIYHMRRKEPAAHNLALFLLAVFVILGRWQW